jgi:nucleoside-diphosphate-sugar epimerase
MSRVLVTGASGLVGCLVVKALLDEGYEVLGLDSSDAKISNKNYLHLKTDLTNVISVERVFNEYYISHVIHLAAIAHKAGQNDLSWSRYYRINTLCAKTIFECAAERKIPVFFSSTVDVYGITDETVTAKTKPQPIGDYAKSKYLAEEALKDICRDSPYTIARFAPVYTEEVKRDIQRRYYLKYPKWCYIIGEGISYEFLSADIIAKSITAWVKNARKQQTIILSDEMRHHTAKLIKAEKQRGLANKTLHLPRRPFSLMGFGTKLLFGRTSYYSLMVSKIVSPIRITRKKEQGYGL